jgi:hypothetical protein
MRPVIILFIAATMLVSCGGVADCRAIHEVTLRVSRHGHALSQRAVSIAMGDARAARFGKSQQATTDAAGLTHTTFDTMWGAAFVVIPPLGLIPPRPPKPDYAVTVGTQRVVVSPQTPGVTYAWRDGAWHTDGAIDIP